jgi:hypothetical protein
MPRYTFLKTDLRCPACQSLVSDLIWFGWGYANAQQPVRENTYRIGDTIRWRRSSEGTLPAWTVFHGYQQDSCNIGDPTIQNVIVLDCASIGWAIDHCPRCCHPIAGAAIEIRQSRIQRAWIFAPGLFDRATEYYVIDLDEAVYPMPAWTEADSGGAWLHCTGMPASDPTWLTSYHAGCRVRPNLAFYDHR